MLTHRPRRAARAALLASAVSVCLVAAAAPDPTPAEPLGVGDRLFPQLGNPGYDVRSYDLRFAYPGSNTRPMKAVTTIEAEVTHRLERINLDFAHGKVSSVTVDGAKAAFAAAGEDLVITPRRMPEPGDTTRIVVRHTSDPRPPKDQQHGWVVTKDGLAMANQADAAHLVFPCNDHPSDKALYTIHVTAPAALTAVANGLPDKRPQNAGRAAGSRTWTYRSKHPMATELVQVAVGRSAVVGRKGPHGLPLRDVVPAADRAKLEPWLAKTPGQIAWMENKVGPYPFETYGVLIADTATGFELETQTLSLFERFLFTEPAIPAWLVESIMVHELAHQWFGDSVTPATWSDVWLNEGHATWYEALYGEETGHRTLEERMKAAYASSDKWRAAGGPPAAPKEPRDGQKIGIFRPVIYDGAALVLYALRQEIGRHAFEQVERAWVHRHQDATATTADFVRLASEVAGRDLDGFFRAWLQDTRTPPMPGHPDWKAEAPTAEGKPAQGRTVIPAPGLGHGHVGHGHMGHATMGHGHMGRRHTEHGHTQ
ncbi:M1 family metallopeptidase [Streptomyces sp. NPDC056600]|uniref:M1 family metallopeptidase n=1 Tax=Streptomyces sp. NPDC056600 TaxID=3345874 RepID=UPI0036A1F575